MSIIGKCLNPLCQGTAGCVCQQVQYTPPPAPLQGWRCPVCGSVYSPFVTECGRCANSLFVTRTTTGTIPPEETLC